MQTYNVFQHAHIDWCSHCVHKKRHYISSSCRQKCSHLADRNISLSADFRMHPDTIVYWLSWMHHLAFPPLTYLTEWVIKSVKIWFTCFGHGWRVAMTTCCSSEQGSGRPIWLFQGRYRLLEIKVTENIYLGPIFICSKNVKSLCQNFDQVSEEK